MGKDKVQQQSGQISEVIMKRFAELIVARIEEMKDPDWKKEWLTSPAFGMPGNASGRQYSNSNSFMLLLLSSMKGYEYPIFLTMNQAHEYGAHIKKGEGSFPVYFWNIIYKNENGKILKPESLKTKTPEELAALRRYPVFKYYNVWNIQQTNLKEVAPQKYDKIVARFKPQIKMDREGMYENQAIDRMVEKQEWLCPIVADKFSNSAFYSPSKDVVTVPMKEQFRTGNTDAEIYQSGMAYYTTLLHEVTHSTMSEDRLGRTGGEQFGDKDYAREELVAEMTSALLGSTMGFTTKLLDNSVAYLDNWIRELKEDPKFLMTILTDVNKASNLIIRELDKQHLALGQAPIKTNMPNDEPAEKTNLKVSLFKDATGQTLISVYNGSEYLGVKPTHEDNFKLFVTLDEKEKQQFGTQLAKKYFAEELKPKVANKPTQKQSF